MATWVKLIGSARSPITEWEKDHVGFRKAKKPSIRAGDHLFLYAPGANRRIFAFAEAVSDPEHDSDYNPSKAGSCRWKLRVRYEINLPVASGILIGDVSTHRDLTKSLRQQSHIKLLPEESESAKSKLRDAKAEAAPMGGPWLYPISAGADRSFTLADGQSIPVTVGSYRTLLENGRILEDLYWYISQNWNNVQIGDELFIYTGDDDLGIIGYAAVGAVEQRADGWCILPRFDLGRSRALLENPVPAAVVRDWVLPRRSVINLAAFQEPLRALLPWTGRDAVTDSVLAEEILQPSGLVEGAVRSITVNAYERNPQARRQCKGAHGTTCCICGFRFGATYGKVADGYIHVHHLRPLSQVNGEYVVDPVKDLRPVCPNCHAVLHLGGECRSIEEVKQMVEDNRA